MCSLFNYFCIIDPTPFFILVTSIKPSVCAHGGLNSFKFLRAINGVGQRCKSLVGCCHLRNSFQLEVFRTNEDAQNVCIYKQVSLHSFKQPRENFAFSCFFFWNGRRLTGLRKCGWYVTEKFGLLRCQRGSTEAAIVSPRFKLEKVGIDISVSTPWADRFQG